MLMKSGKYAVDRIEGELAVLISDEDGTSLHLPWREHSLKVNDILLLDFDGDRLVSLKRLDGEKEERLKNNRSRLSALFAKGNKK